MSDQQPIPAVEEQRRKEILALHPAPRNVAGLRRRWDPSEVERICQMLKVGRWNWHRIGEIRCGDTTYVDLRGMNMRGPEIGHREEPTERWPVLKGVDFSACEVVLPVGGFADIAAEGCRFVSADLGQELRGRFTRCDFSRAVLQNGWITGEFTDCRFVGAKLRRAYVSGRFVRCDFSAADLGSGEFSGVYEECNWTACRPGFGVPFPVHAEAVIERAMKRITAKMNKGAAER